MYYTPFHLMGVDTVTEVVFLQFTFQSEKSKSMKEKILIKKGKGRVKQHLAQM
jgi:hypothetical protein